MQRSYLQWRVGKVLWCCLLITQSTSAFLSARNLYKRGQLFNSIPSSAPSPDSSRSVYEKAVFKACKDRKGHKAVELIRVGVPHDCSYSPSELRNFRNKALRWLGNYGQWREALLLFEEEHSAWAEAAAENEAKPPSVVPMLLPPDAWTWSAVLGACGSARPAQWKTALQLLHEMRREQTKPTAPPPWQSIGVDVSAGVPPPPPIVSVIHVGLAMKACARAGRVEETLRLLNTCEAMTAPIDHTPNGSYYGSPEEYPENAAGEDGSGGRGITRGQKPNLRLFNQAIDACSRRGMLRRILDDMLPEMDVAGVEPDTWTFNLALKACEFQSRSSDEESGESATMSSVVQLAAVDRHATDKSRAPPRGGGGLQGMFEVLAAMTAADVARDTVTYNSCIAVCMAVGTPRAADLALSFLKELEYKYDEQRGEAESEGSEDATTSSIAMPPPPPPLRPDNRTYCSVIAACGAANRWRDALAVFEDAIARLPSDRRPALPVFNAALDAICCSGSPSAEHSEHSSMAVIVSPPPNMDERLRFSFTGFSASNGDVSAATTAHDAARGAVAGASKDGEHLKKNCDGPSAQRQALRRRRRVGQVHLLPDILEALHREPGVRPDRYTWNTVMKAHALNGDSTSAFNVLLEMRSLNIKPRIRDYNVVLKACATEGSEEEEEEEEKELDGDNDLFKDEDDDAKPHDRDGTQTVQDVGDSRQFVLTKVRQRVLGADLKERKANDAVRLLLEMEEKYGVLPDSYSYSSAIIACGKAGQPLRALGLLDKMEAKFYQHQARQTANLQSGCGDDSGGESSSRTGRKISRRRDMGRHGQIESAPPPPPNLFVYRAALSVAVQAGLVDEARNLLWRAKAAPYLISPTRQVRSSYDEDESGEGTDRAEGFRASIKTGSSVGLIEHTMLLRAYESKGDWSNAYEMMREIQALSGSSASPDESILSSSSLTASSLAGSSVSGNGGKYAVLKERALELLSKTERESKSAVDRHPRGAVDSNDKEDSRSIAFDSVVSLKAEKWQQQQQQQRSQYERVRRQTFNAAVVACAHGGQWESALYLVRGMLRKSGAGSVDPVAFSATLSALHTGGRHRQCLVMFRDWLAQYEVSRTGATSTDSEVGVIRDGADFSSSRMLRVSCIIEPPDAVAFGTAMEAAAALEDWAEVLSIYRACESLSTIAKTTPQQRYLAACAYRYLGDWEEGLAFALDTTAAIAGEAKEEEKGAEQGQQQVVEAPVVTIGRLEKMVVQIALALVEARRSECVDILLHRHRFPRPTIDGIATILDFIVEEDRKVKQQQQQQQEQQQRQRGNNEAELSGVDRVSSLGVWADQLYSNFIKDGRLESCCRTVRDASIPPSGVHTIAFPLLVVDLAAIASDALAILALRHAIRNEIKSMVTNWGTVDRGDDEEEDEVVTIRTDAYASRLKLVIYELETMDPPLLRRDPASQTTKSRAAKWNSGNRVHIDRVILTARTLRSWALQTALQTENQ